MQNKPFPANPGMPFYPLSSSPAGMHPPHLFQNPPVPSNKPKSRKVFKLGLEQGPNFMEGFLKEGKLYSIYNSKDYGNQRGDERNDVIRKDFRDRFRKMKSHPQHYFNFAFTMNDYIQYVCKHYFMRLERDMIRKSGEPAVDSNN